MSFHALCELGFPRRWPRVPVIELIILRRSLPKYRGPLIVGGETLTGSPFQYICRDVYCVGMATRIRAPGPPIVLSLALPKLRAGTINAEL